mmetsp:Transcript_33984/g.33132  ORF Transcript_33984/g.33132 Transcript_33984/m.33132 type:complete len:84 (+) Transcript_33984:425-676(+)
MWIPNSFFKGFMNFALYTSLIFLIYQALLMLIVAYKLNDVLIGKYNETHAPGLAAVVIALTVIISGGNVTLIVYEYIWFSGCG